MERKNTNKGRQAALAAAWRWGDGLGGEQWRGTGGASERVCAEALLYWATRRGGTVFVASIDEIALEAGMSRSAARRALTRLRARGLVQLRSSGDGRRASIWELRGGGEGTAAAGGGAEDWTRWGAIGKSAFLTWRACIGGVGEADVARMRGITIGHARRTLRSLATRGLVHKDTASGVWYACDPSGIKGVRRRSGAYEAAAGALAATRAARAKRGQTHRKARFPAHAEHRTFLEMNRANQARATDSKNSSSSAVERT